MDLQPSEQVGQLSPDGLWRWDGQRWISTGRPTIATHAKRGPLWWLFGGCALLLVLAIAAGIWGVASLVRSAQQQGLSCMPSDFPRYPNATMTRDFRYVGTNVAPGDSQECQETLDSADDVTAVTTFYTRHLDTGDWTITAIDPTNGEIRFHQASRPASLGVVDLLAAGQHTVIEIRFDS